VSTHDYERIMTKSSKNTQPLENTGKSDGATKSWRRFSVSCGDAAPSLELKEGIFHEMTDCIDILVIFTLGLPVTLRWDDNLYFVLLGKLYDFICVVSFVSNQHFRRYTVDQSDCKLTIRCCTFRDSESDRHTIRINRKVNLRVEPPFVRPMSWFPPTAPAACGWTLQCEASIISHSKSGSSIICSSIASQWWLSHQRLNLRCTALYFPYCGGRSRHGQPVRIIQNDPFTNIRLSFALLPPQSPILFLITGSSFAHWASVRSCLFWSVFICYPLFICRYIWIIPFIHFFVNILRRHCLGQLLNALPAWFSHF